MSSTSGSRRSHDEVLFIKSTETREFCEPFQALIHAQDMKHISTITPVGKDMLF